MNSVEPVRRLPNFVDAISETLAKRESTVGVLTRLLELRGYERIEPPMLEQAELFVRKSGGELASRLYGFTEPGGYRVGLRPEFTAPVLRHAIETASAGGWPRRYQYSGPIFRYASPEEEHGGKTRQSTQVGAEIIGSDSSMADGEVVCAALEGLASVGVPEPIAVMGHVGILWEVLRPFGLSDRARLFLVNSVGELRRGIQAIDHVRSEAERLGLTGDDQAAGITIPPGATLTDVMAVIDATIGPTDRNAGVRSRAEIVERLARKQTVSGGRDSFEKAFDLIVRLAAVRGEPTGAVETGREIISGAGGNPATMDSLQRVIDATIAHGAAYGSLVVDLGLARGIAYYSGMVFDLHSVVAEGDSLGGGGRYDGLTRALGADSDLPALGFAYALEAVMDVATEDAAARQKGNRVVVSPTEEAAIPEALREATRLREQGVTAILDFEVRTREERESFAMAAHASTVVSVDPSGKAQGEAVK